MELQLLGTSHIAKESIQEIKQRTQTWKPDIIAVELDLERANDLMSNETRKTSMSIIPEIGIKGYLFAKIGQIVQQHLGKSVGISPGSEMKTAIELAQKDKLHIAFIDQPIRITLRNFSKQFTWREKFRFAQDFCYGLFFPKRYAKQLGFTQFDLNKVPSKELITKMMHHMKKNYPSLYKTLVEDRNRYMVKQLIKLMHEHPDKKILAIVGAGHESGMKELLLKVDIVR